MYRKIFFSLFTAVMCFTVLIILKWKSINTISDNNKVIPSFSFLKLDSSLFETKDINRSNPTTIISYYHPNCEHCQNMATLFAANSNKIAHVNVIMVSFAPIPEIVDFRMRYKLTKLKSIVFLFENDKSFSKIFGECEVPTSFVYKGKNILRRINGESSLDNLLKGI